MKVTLFDIQRGSAVDGPGLRTAVFFKGCNLRCLWCHNPESQNAQSEMMLFKHRCISCGLCRTVCPKHTDDNGCFICENCGQCAMVCPHDARRLCGYDIDTDVLCEKLLRDRDYYTATGGGVTFTGGECLLQMDALLKLLSRLGRTGIHRAVDTAGNVPWTVFEQIMPETDLFLYDIKAYSCHLHRELTGAGNERILDNYIRLQQMIPDRIYVRVPVIPNANDVDNEMKLIAEFLEKYPPAKIELLPYHAMGVGKAEALNRKVNIYAVPAPERMQQLKQMFGI